MKTIIEINGSNYGSTGNIAINIAKKARLEGFQVYNFVSISKESKKHKYDNQVYFGIWLERIFSERLSYITGQRDHYNILGTYKLIQQIKQTKPDLIHLHLLHDNFINLKILFQYLKKSNIPVVWTFHDVWPLTGQCPAFEMIGCDKWINGCNHCPQWHNQPKSLLFDTSNRMWNEKKQLFSNFNNLTIVTPSKWLQDKVKQSYFKNNNAITINNGIDLNMFKYEQSDFRQRYNLTDKYIVLGVANYWERRKGLDVFIELSKSLPNNYQIVLIGTNNSVDKKLPSNIISIHRTFNQKELVKIYSTADVFVNPTREDVFGLVNVEALACGTPVLVFKTGGCPEIVDDACGKVIEKDDIKSLQENIINTCTKTPYKKENCLAKAKQFDNDITYNKYIDLYKKLTNY